MTKEMNFAALSHGMRVLDVIVINEDQWSIVVQVAGDSFVCLPMRWYHRLLLPLARLIYHFEPRGGAVTTRE